MGFLAAVCLGCLWRSWVLPWQNQRRAVDLIRAHNGMGGVEFGEYRYEPMDEFPFWKRTLADWLGRDSVARVALAFSDGTGELIDISCWKDLPSVERVSFDRALIENLSPIAGFNRLKSFSIYQCGCTPPKGKRGLEVLGTCPNLESVRLTSSQFPMNDEVLASICKARNLREFEFATWDCTKLDPLLNLHKLETLKVWLDTPPYVVDLRAIGDLSILRELWLYVSSRNDVEYDFSFLRRLVELKTVSYTHLTLPTIYSV